MLHNQDEKARFHIKINVESIRKVQEEYEKDTASALEGGASRRY